MSDLDLVVWLKRQLDDDERDADGIHRYEGGMSPLTCDHIVAAGHDRCTCGVPARVLREVEAKRRILGRHQPIEIFGVMLCTHCGVVGGQRARAVAAWPCPELRDLVAPYSDCPGYRPEWAPQ